MKIIEIVDNPNCQATERVFHDVEAPQPVAQVRLTQANNTPQWYDIIGWSAEGHPCPAWLQKVDDSGEGVSLLIFGGDAGLRLRPTQSSREWSVQDPVQWGEPFLLLGDTEDIRRA